MFKGNQDKYYVDRREAALVIAATEAISQLTGERLFKLNDALAKYPPADELLVMIQDKAQPNRGPLR